MTEEIIEKLRSIYEEKKIILQKQTRQSIEKMKK